MEKMYFAQKAFIIHNNNILLVRKSDDDPDQAGFWEVPGGRMEFGEDINHHIVREVHEEVGIDIIPKEPFHIWQWQLKRTISDGQIVNIQIVAVARLCIPITIDINANSQVEEDFISDIEWVEIERINKYPLIKNMVPAMNEFLKKIGRFGIKG